MFAWGRLLSRHILLSVFLIAGAGVSGRAVGGAPSNDNLANAIDLGNTPGFSISRQS